MANLSKQKREEFITKIEALKQKKAIDDTDKLFLNDIINELNEKRYGLIWEKHSETVDEMMINNIPVFTEDADKKIVSEPELPYNFLLEGDNLHSLKLLEKTHKGKIDVIYIDPPYNTGNKDFVYEDKMIGTDDGYRHSKWLSFMNERLQIARDLLSDNGVMFISIDENEFSQLKLLCDSIFNEENIETIIWNKVPEYGTAGSGKMKITYRFRVDHEYILVRYKDKLKTYFDKPLKIPNWKTKYPNKDKDPRGNWCDGELCKSEEKSNAEGKNYYSITSPSGKTTFTRQWHCTKEEFEQYLKDTAITEDGKIVSRIWWGSDGEKCPRLKKFQNMPQPTTPTSIIKNISQTDGNNELKALFGIKTFDNPKPVGLIKELLYMISNKDAIILDFFAGSGTTVQVVMELNAEDGGNRKYILCTNNENNICEDVTYQRLKTVITGIRKDGSKYSDGIPANLKYYKTDFVSKISKDDDYFTEDKLTQNIKEMIELENAVEIDNDKYILLLTDEEADTFEQEMKDKNVKKVYIDSTIMLSGKAQSYLDSKQVEVIPIPDYYFYKDINAG